MSSNTVTFLRREGVFGTNVAGLQRDVGGSGGGEEENAETATLATGLCSWCDTGAATMEEDEREDGDTVTSLSTVWVTACTGLRLE